MKEDKFMPLVRVDMIKGKTPEYKKTVLKGYGSMLMNHWENEMRELGYLIIRCKENVNKREQKMNVGCQSFSNNTTQMDVIPEELPKELTSDSFIILGYHIYRYYSSKEDIYEA